MSERKVTMPMRIAAACLFTALPVVILVMLAGDLSQALSPVLPDEVALEDVMSEEAAPTGSFITVRGIPKSCITIGTPSDLEALIILQHAPYLVLYTPYHHDLSREALASDPGGEFYETQVSVSGRIGVPPADKLPPEDLERFVKTEIGPNSMDKVRVLYVGVDPYDSRAKAILGGTCVAFSLVIAMVAWLAVVVALVREKRPAANAAPSADVDAKQQE